MRELAGILGIAFVLTIALGASLAYLRGPASEPAICIKPTAFPPTWAGRCSP